MKFAPIALFAYNRSDHLRRAVESLLMNPLAAASDVWVFSDAAKRPADEPAVSAVRTYLRQVVGFKSVVVVERERNLGLAASIIDGVTLLCREYGRVIIVEDDLVVAPIFLEFMNRALDRYEDEESVMQVSGYMYPVRRPEDLPEVFLCGLPTSWGWATWARAWVHFERDTRSLAGRLSDEHQRYAFDLQGSYPYYETLLAQERGELDVWGVRWYASVFLQCGLCLYPSCSLVHNAGMDGSGVHCGASRGFDVDLAQARLGAFPDELEECRPAVEQIIEFYRSLSAPTFNRVLRRLGRRLHRALGLA
jgi:hypothetical protein